MNFSKTCLTVFEKAIEDFHIQNDIDQIAKNPFPVGQLEHLLYKKNYIDTVQWHLEDIVRDPNIAPDKGLMIKRRIDQSNQERTDIVEKIDDHLRINYNASNPFPDAKINTESPAWAIDRLSILVLKIYHMKEEVMRKDASVVHKENCELRLKVLLEQRADLAQSIDELMDDIQAGRKRMKVYRQMKMYNDPSLNPVLYNQQKQ